MNDLFNARRFLLLLKKTFIERPVQTFGIMGLLLVLSVILYAVVKKIAGFSPAQNITLIWGLAGGGFFLTSFVFGYFGTNANGCSYLTLPVSFLEKWLCAIVIAGILYPVVFLSCYHLIDVIFVAAYHRSLDPTSIFYRQLYDGVFTEDLNGRVAWKIYSLFLTFNGCMLMGGLYFNRTAFIKTAITIASLFLIIWGADWMIANLLFDHVQDAAPYYVTLSIGKETGTLILPTKIEGFFHDGFAYVIPLILWVLPLVRLREKEF